MADHIFPDYELPEQLALTDPQQYRALFEPTRTAIVGLLLERAATTSELAEVLDKPKGTVGHHLKVLQDAGLVRVVRTEQVRALQAKYYGRTARIFFYERIDDAVGAAQRILESAAAEIGAAEALVLEEERHHPDRPAGHHPVLDANRRDVRIPHTRAAEFGRRLGELLVEFADEPRAGDRTYSMVYAIFPTGRKPLRDPGGTPAASSGDAGDDE